ncbi:MAG: hypothetical protein V3R45_00735 [Candidatus Aminicenantaceae bacterium]
MKKSAKTHKKVLKLLYRSFDTDLSEREQQRLDEALEQSKDLREERELILSRRQVVADSAVKSFRPYFADRVISQIAAIEDKKDTQESFYDALMFVFRRFAFVGALVMIGLIFFNVINGHIIPVDEIFFASDLALEEILNLPIF